MIFQNRFTLTLCALIPIILFAGFCYGFQNYDRNFYIYERIMTFFFIVSFFLLCYFKKKNAELIMEAAVEKYRLLFDQFPLGITKIDKDGFIVEANASFECILGVKKGYIIKHKFDLIKLRILDHDGAEIPHNRRPLTKAIRERQIINDCDMMIKSEDGKMKWLNLTVFPSFDENNCTMAIYEDITALKIAERTLKESEEKFRLMIENTPVGVSIIDDCGIFEYVNEAFSSLYEYDQEELIGKHITVIVLENLYEMALKSYKDFIDNSIPLSRQWSATTKYGKKLEVLVSSAKINGAGEHPKTILSVMDITERQHMEDELRRNREELKIARETAESMNSLKTSFLANVSHEIRTPLNSIIGFSDLLEHDWSEKERAEMIGCIKTSGKELLSMVNDLLDISKIEAGKLEIETAEFDLKPLAEEITAMMKPAAELKKIGISMELKGKFNEPVISDRHRYKQVIINLLGNAIKFTSNGGVKLTISILEEDDNNYLVETSVSDSGIGISQKDIERIFIPFMQANCAVSRKFGGTGLGLSISDKIVKMLGGKGISVESEPGAGSRFYFTIKFKKAVSAMRVNKLKPDAKQGIKEDTGDPLISMPTINENFALNVLVADDDRMNLILIKKSLEEEGVAVTSVETARDSVEFALKYRYDLILIDINMPDMSGFDASREIRRLGIKTPVVAMSASALENDMDDLTGSGMNDQISKPVDVKLLISKAHHLAGKFAHANV